MFHARNFHLLSIVSVLMLFVACTPGGPIRQGTVHPFVSEEVDLYVGGQDGYACYRIPALVVTINGTILAFCEARKNNCHDDGDIDLVLKRSSDLGRTWSPMQLVFEEGGDAPITIGNPCPIVDMETGVIHLVLTRNNKRAFYSSSTDDGQAFAPLREITEDLKQADFEWQRLGTGPGHGMITGDGTLVVPTWLNYRLYKKVDGSQKCIRNDYRTVLLMSCDQGQSWQVSRVAPVENSNEAMITESPDGNWRLDMRVVERKMRTTARTQDQGWTWSTPKPLPMLPDPVCQASCLRIPLGDGKTGLVFSNPASNTRERLTVRLSEDDGETWPYARLVCTGRSAYSDLALLNDGSIAMLYERGINRYNERLTFVRFNLGWLRDDPG